MSNKSTIATSSAALGGGAIGAGIATAVGSSIPVLTTVGSWVGIGITAATPVGWVIAAGAAGAAVCAGTAVLCQKIGEAEKLEMIRKSKKRQAKNFF